MASLPGPTGSARGGGLPRVQSPATATGLRCSPRAAARFQSLELLCAVPVEPRPRWTWLLDGVARANVKAPYSLRWELEPGEHTVAVASAGQRSRPVAFVVYGAEQGGQVQRRRSARVTSSCRERPAPVSVDGR